MMILPNLLRLRVFAAAAVRPVARLARTLRNRHAVTKLGHLDERALKDIGLTRSDVLGALAAPLTRDPSLILAEHVHGESETTDVRKVMAADAALPLSVAVCR